MASDKVGKRETRWMRSNSDARRELLFARGFSALMRYVFPDSRRHYLVQPEETRRRGTAAKPIVEVVPYEKVKHSLVDGQRPPMWCVYDFRFLTWSKAAAGAIMIGLRRLMSISVPVAMFLLVFADHGFGQALVGGQTALDNAGGAGARSPGNMVSAGVAQTLDFGGHVTIITEQAATDGGLLAQTIAASLDILFEQLNQALLLFHNLLLARAGRPPAIPGLGLKAVRIEEPRPGNLVQTARLQAKARRSPR